MSLYGDIKDAAKAAALEAERASFQAWLEHHGGNVTATAKALGCTYALLQYALQKHPSITYNRKVKNQ